MRNDETIVRDFKDCTNLTGTWFMTRECFRIIIELLLDIRNQNREIIENTKSPASKWVGGPR